MVVCNSHNEYVGLALVRVGLRCVGQTCYINTAVYTSNSRPQL